MYTARRHSWNSLAAHDLARGPPEEDSPLLPGPGRAGTDEAAAVAARKRVRHTVGHPDGKGPDAPKGILGALSELSRNYGTNFLLYLVVIEHVMKGFVVQLCTMAEPYVYASYSVPAPEMQMYLSVTNLPWSMKPIIGLVSDAFPIGGYNKAPYIILTSVIGTAAFAVIGLLPKDLTPLALLVGCCFLMSLQVVTADILTQGKFTQKVKSSPSLTGGTDLLTFVWFGIDAAALVGMVGSGFTIAFLGPKAAFIISAVPAFFVLVLIWRGWLEEARMSEDEAAEIRFRFLQQGTVCLLVVLMFFGTVALPVTIMSNGGAVATGIVSLGVTAMMLFSSSLVLTPAIMNVNAFSLAQSVVGFKIDAATFYFFTDTETEYPEGPHFSKFFFNTCMGSVQLAASLLGIYTYQRFSRRWTYRQWLLMANVAAALANVGNILMFRRVNVGWGIPDWIWGLASVAVYHTVERWRWMPLFVSFSYLAPAGMEATMFALLMGCHNLGVSVAGNLGAWLLSFLECRPEGKVGESAQFESLWVACAWQSVVPLACVLTLFTLLPNERQNKSLLSGDGADATSGSLLQRWRKQAA